MPDFQQTQPGAIKPARPPSIFDLAWRPAGLLYLATLLAGLAVGFWSDVFFPSVDGINSPALPALRIVGVAQAAFFFLAMPLIIFRRSAQLGEPYRLLPLAMESAVLLAVSLPVYAAAAYVSDATWRDAARLAILAAMLTPAAWAGGCWLRRPDGRCAALMALMLICLGGPAGWYMLREFLPMLPSDWLWSAAPLTLAWQVAESRRPCLMPGPTWAAVLWPLAAAASGLLAIMVPRRDEQTSQ